MSYLCTAWSTKEHIQKAKQFLSGLTVPGSWRFWVWTKSAQKLARLLALHSGRLCRDEIFLVLISVRVWVDPRAIERPEGLLQWIIPKTPSGIEPAAQWLSQLRHRVPPWMYTCLQTLRFNNRCYLMHTVLHCTVTASRICLWLGSGQ
jgi:hypothetical protein